ncbi:S-layer homology domain-containing protein [Candidatus Pseudoscillospira sp. SGI.172]|uniref:S-layer homology domain-containing protein n=1 Tax=Candidatus Pseudoscillospira sp. SGI.172 TaxID=3420582 RepID=UPI003D035F1B
MRSLTCLALSLLLLTTPALGAAPEPVTRGDFAVLLWQSAGGVPYDVSTCPFSDVGRNTPYAQAVCWAWDEGVIRGVGEGLFAPDRLLTREECAALLRRNDARLGRDTFFPDAGICNDFQDISPWADDSLYWACSTGRMAWLENRLAPCAPVTQAEAEGYFSAPSRF